MRKSMQETSENSKIRKNAQNANSDFKYKRILQLYTRLLKGEVINKAKEAAAANVTERSIKVGRVPRPQELRTAWAWVNAFL